MPHQLLYEDELLKLATCQNCVVAGWHGPPTAPLLAKLEAAGVGLHESLGCETAMVNIVCGGVPKFSADAREEAARQTETNRMHSIGTAHVVLVGGLAGVAARTFMSTVIMMGRPDKPTKVFSNIRDAAAWMRPMLDEIPGGPAWTDTVLTEACEAVI